MSVLSSSAQCSDITLAEYAPQLRAEVDKWINKAPDAHDWTPLIKYIATKENVYVLKCNKLVIILAAITQAISIHF